MSDILEDALLVSAGASTARLDISRGGRRQITRLLVPGDYYYYYYYYRVSRASNSDCYLAGGVSIDIYAYRAAALEARRRCNP